MKILTIIGARPQFIKAAIVSRALRLEREDITEVLLHTGQHYDSNMSDVFFDELEIPAPKYNLGIGGGTHGQNTGRMVEAIETVLLDEKPDWLLVYGDTDSTLAGALAASKLHIPVAHVEAGLRSFNRAMPEEINRVLTDHISALLFTPTNTGLAHLSSEGITGDHVHQIGDVMYDAALYYGQKADKESNVLATHNLTSKGFVLVTIHRPANTDSKDRLYEVLHSLSQSRLPVVWPLHPRTKARMGSFGLSLPANVIAIDPVGYLDMVSLERHATLIATDSGGVQKEAFFHKVPCVTLRPETEWTELVSGGVNRLSMNLSANDFEFMPDAALFEQPYYGDGTAARKIAKLFS